MFCCGYVPTNRPVCFHKDSKPKHYGEQNIMDKAH